MYIIYLQSLSCYKHICIYIYIYLFTVIPAMYIIHINNFCRATISKAIFTPVNQIFLSLICVYWSNYQNI